MKLRAALALSFLIGCGPGASTAEDVFIALPKDFVSFKTWQHFELPDSEVPNSPHTSGPRTVFINRLPAKGSSAFPVRTLIVKTIASGQAFAMSKRGGDYNALGASGWEWFELRPATDGTPAIVWRGITPPIGESYSGIAGGTCNDCHAGAKTNDFVQTSVLRLSDR